MSVDRKIENEIFDFSVCLGKQTYASEMRRKQRNLGTESCLTANDESENRRGNTVYSINVT